MSDDFFRGVLTDCLLLLQAEEVNFFNAAEIARAAGHIFESVSGTLEAGSVEPLKHIASAAVGFDVDYRMADFNALGSNSLSPGKRASQFGEAFINIYMRELKKSARLIDALATFLVALLRSAGVREELAKLIPDMGEQIGIAFGINPSETVNVVRIMQYDVQALVDFVAPYCRLNPEKMHILVSILADTYSALTRFNKLAITSPQTVLDEGMRTAYSSLMKKVTEGTADLKDLFRVVDMEGDSSGGISKREFVSLLSKLNITASEHRINEIFSICKTKMSSKIDELNETGTI